MMAESTEFDEIVERETLRIEITPTAVGSKPTIFSLHGGGPSNRVRASYIAEEFCRHGKSTLRFDFSGQGDSSGLMAESSLQKRRMEALAIAKHLQPEGTVVIGTSMGAHIACRLTSFMPISHLVLFCPAAYGAAAETAAFGSDFTSIIRQPQSYLDSLAWSDLSTFKGHAAIIIGNEDAIIPGEVVELYQGSLKQAASLVTLNIGNCPHNIHDWLGQNPAQQRMVLDFLMSFARQ